MRGKGLTNLEWDARQESLYDSTSVSNGADWSYLWSAGVMRSLDTVVGEDGREGNDR